MIDTATPSVTLTRQLGLTSLTALVIGEVIAVGILQITLIAAWFNYINRVADALGVGRD